MRIHILIFFLLLFQLVNAQQHIDIKHYDLSISLEDTTDVILVTEKVILRINEQSNSFALNLVNQDIDGTGMRVSLIQFQDDSLQYFHKDNILQINLPQELELKSKQIECIIHYSGIPKDGLVIGENKYGKRTFFGDNWPTRAQNWFACVDHPSDKATIDFHIKAPSHYDIVAVGEKVSEKQISNNRKLTDYSLRHPIPTKVMVFGAADFSHKEIAIKNDLPIQSWVYQEDSSASYSDLEVAVDPLKFFTDKIAPYPFDKLANVQSTTRFGGMENAGCIFYDENAFSGEHQMENLIAHEIAHQWFGNSASESDWQHLWLSEGFATYLTNCHLENKYGKEAMNQHLQLEREKVIQFENQIKRPVIDTISESLMDLLNPNSYQKGSWFLHMLRNRLGDEAFWKGIQHYYKKYRYSNASTNDFRAIMELQSKSSLKTFFDQWLKGNEMPNLTVKVKKKCRKRIVTITQIQNQPFSFPLEVGVIENGVERTILLQFTPEIKTIELTLSKKSARVIKLDPNTKLLFKETPVVVLQKQ